MGWGVDFKADIFLSKQSYPTRYSVEDRIKELDSEIGDCEATLKMYASATPRDIIPADYSDQGVFWFNIQINAALEEYREHILDRYRLQLYLEYLNDGGELVKSE